MGYFSDGQTITNKVKVFKNYMKAEFWYDFVPTMSLILTEEDDNFIYFVYLEFLRVFQLKKLTAKVEFHFNLYEKYTTPTRLLKLIFIIMSVAHYTGLGFIYIGKIQYNSEGSWIHLLSSDNTYKQYLDGLYFSVITMSTVGYGDFSPVTSIEKIYVIIITIIACGVFAYAINQVGTIFQEQEQKNAQIRRERFQLLSYLQQKQVKSSLQTKALNYLKFVHEIELDNEFENGRKILNKISKNIQDDILFNNYMKIITKSSFFVDNFSEKFLQNLCLKFKEKKFGPGELILNYNEINNKIYFVLEGTLDIQYQRDTQVDYKIGAPDYIFKGPQIVQNDIIGIPCIFQTQKSQYSVISRTISHVAHISQYDFLESLTDFIKDKQVFQDLKEQESLKILNLNQCFFCRSFHHKMTLCNLTQYIPNQMLLISKYNYIGNQIQTTQTKINRNNLRQNSLIIKKNISQKLKLFRIQNAIDPNSVFLVIDDQNQDLFQQQVEGISDLDFYKNFPSYNFIVEIEDSEQQINVDQDFHINYESVKQFQVFLNQEEMEMEEKEQKDYLDPTSLLNPPDLTNPFQEKINQSNLSSHDKNQTQRSQDSIILDEKDNTVQKSAYRNSQTKIQSIPNSFSIQDNSMRSFDIRSAKRNSSINLIAQQLKRKSSYFGSYDLQAPTFNNIQRSSIMNNLAPNTISSIPKQSKYVCVQSQNQQPQQIQQNQFKQNKRESIPQLQQYQSNLNNFQDDPNKNYKNQFGNNQYTQQNTFVNNTLNQQQTINNNKKYSQYPNIEDELIDSTMNSFFFYKKKDNYDLIIQKINNKSKYKINQDDTQSIPSLIIPNTNRKKCQNENNDYNKILKSLTTIKMVNSHSNLNQSNINNSSKKSLFVKKKTMGIPKLALQEQNNYSDIYSESQKNLENISNNIQEENKVQIITTVNELLVKILSGQIGQNNQNII